MQYTNTKIFYQSVIPPTFCMVLSCFLYFSGDRILSVTISFENMVYEDALTILSYASPYPVRVTLQKEKIVRKDRRVSETPSTLSHPLYRSQSMDTLKKIRKDSSTIIPQRSFSEMRPEKKKNNQLKLSPDSLMPPRNDAFPTIQENGSKRDSAILNEDDVFQVPKETVVIVENEPPNLTVPSVRVDMVDEKTTSSPGESTATAFAAQLFDKLNEQDKLDMLRLSYEDPHDSTSNSKVVISSAETSFTETPRSVDSNELDNTVVESKSAPIKPERRKKKTSSGSSISSCDQPNSPRVTSLTFADDAAIQDVVTSVQTQMSESQPKSSSYFDEISEDIIRPEIKDRKVTVTSDKIEFSDVDISINNDSSRSSPDIGSRTLVDYSLSDMENTIRPTTPDNFPTIEEELITPEHAKRDSSEPLVSNLVSFQGTLSDSSKNSSLNSDGKNETVIKASNSSSSLSGSDDEKNESKLQNTSEVDFNVTSSNPSLFSTPYPSRNTKEAASGMSYDISMNELNDIESQMSQKSKFEKNMPKGGIAFEVRDDFTSGTAKTVSVESKSSTVVRTMSCFDKIGSVEQTEKTNQMLRTGSFKDFKKDADDSSLDWSGKRLVRSGSFSDIPQDDSINDWRDHNVIDDSDTINSETSLNDDIISSNDSINEMEQKGLKNSNFFRARENLANLSDNSESLQSLQSLTESSSRSSTPPPPYNTKDNGLGSSPESVKIPNNLSSTGVIINTDSDNNIIPTVKIENKENIRVSVTTAGHDEDTDC